MKKFERLDEAAAPDGTTLTLYRHDTDYFIRADGVELMSTRRHHSEERLAELVCEPLRHVERPRVMIGGLGFGFTLRAALRTLDADAEVIVVELVEAVIRWNRDPDYGLGGDALQDARVTLLHEDVAGVLAANAAGFDGIMLDVDNGTDALTSQRNAQLYRKAGIRKTVTALRPGGRLGYWSATEDRALADALSRAGMIVVATPARAHVTAGPLHMVYVAHRNETQEAQ
jgi:spermidine synthase